MTAIGRHADTHKHRAQVKYYSAFQTLALLQALLLLFAHPCPYVFKLGDFLHICQHATFDAPVIFCKLAFSRLQVVLDEVAGRQVAVNNRAGRSNGQVDALLRHVDALLESNGNTLFTPSIEAAPVAQPAGYDCHATHHEWWARQQLL